MAYCNYIQLQEPFVNSCIVRLYRQDEKEPGEIAGIVEQSDNGERHAFKDMEGLCETLRSAAKKGTATRTGRKKIIFVDKTGAM